jgi:hypothetical protein
MSSVAMRSREIASKTATRSSFPARLTKALPLAKATSVGSSPTSSVVISFPASPSMTLMVSERWFATQTS